MIYLKTDEEVELLRKANLLVGYTLAELAKVIQPGVMMSSYVITVRLRLSKGSQILTEVRFLPVSVHQ